MNFNDFTLDDLNRYYTNHQTELGWNNYQKSGIPIKNNQKATWDNTNKKWIVSPTESITPTQTITLYPRESWNNPKSQGLGSEEVHTNISNIIPIVRQNLDSLGTAKKNLNLQLQQKAQAPTGYRYKQWDPRSNYLERQQIEKQKGELYNSILKSSDINQTTRLFQAVGDNIQKLNQQQASLQDQRYKTDSAYRQQIEQANAKLASDEYNAAINTADKNKIAHLGAIEKYNTITNSLRNNTTDRIHRENTYWEQLQKQNEVKRNAAYLDLDKTYADLSLRDQYLSNIDVRNWTNANQRFILNEFSKLSIEDPLYSEFVEDGKLNIDALVAAIESGDERLPASIINRYNSYKKNYDDAYKRDIQQNAFNRKKIEADQPYYLFKTGGSINYHVGIKPTRLIDWAEHNRKRGDAYNKGAIESVKALRAQLDKDLDRIDKETLMLLRSVFK